MKINWRKPIIYLLLYLSGSKIPKILREIEAINKLPPSKKKKYQQKKLEKILLHAHNNVPYYHKILKKSGVISKGKINLKNFQKIPPLTKEIIRKEGKNLYSKDYQQRKPYENSSGGSTGEPVKFIQDKEYDDWNIATKIFYKKLGGQDIGEKELRLWGSERDILEGGEKLSIRIRNWLYNRKELNAFRMSVKKMEEFVEIWNKFKPQWVEGYVQSIYEFSKFIEEKKLNIYSPRGILVSAGTLYESMRKKIEKIFKCPVFNRYGSREVGAIACSFPPSKKLEISFWHNYVEIIKEKNNKMGKILITTLNNYSMPLIRYDIGDLGILSQKWGVLEKIVGREVNIFKTKRGELIDGEFFTHLFYFRNWVKKFQIIQKDYNFILIKIVGNKNKKEMLKIEENIKKVMGKNCQIKWQFLKQIKPLKSGKFLYTISEVK